MSMNSWQKVWKFCLWFADYGTTQPFSGTIRDLTKFDAGFFGVPPKLANVMDPQLRMLLEVTYETFVDAGIFISFDLI